MIIDKIKGVLGGGRKETAPDPVKDETVPQEFDYAKTEAEPSRERPPIDDRITFGSVAKDKITGFEGVVTARNLMMTGTIHWQLCTQDAKDSKLKGFDPERLEYVNSDFEHLAVELDDYDPDILGKVVKHRLTGFSGTVDSVLEQIGGCVFLEVVGKYVEGHKDPCLIAFDDHKKFEPVGVGVSAASSNPVPQARTGNCLAPSFGPRER